MDTLSPVEPSLNTYFAVQLAQGENPRKLIGYICKAANEVNTLFRRIEAIDVIQVAGRSFLRCRSDLLNPYLMLDKLYTQNRGYVVGRSGGYEAKFPDGRKGNVPGLMMHSIPLGGHRESYKGPKLKMWERQFPE